MEFGVADRHNERLVSVLIGGLRLLGSRARVDSVRRVANEGNRTLFAEPAPLRYKQDGARGGRFCLSNVPCVTCRCVPIPWCVARARWAPPRRRALCAAHLCEPEPVRCRTALGEPSRSAAGRSQTRKALIWRGVKRDDVNVSGVRLAGASRCQTAVLRAHLERAIARILDEP